MEINLDSASIQDGISDLVRLGQEAHTAATDAHQVSLDASYSGVPGLDQLGSGHGGVLAGGPGSAVSILESYAQQIEWLEQALNASATALTGQNNFVSRGMEIADEGGYVGADSLSFPQRPFPRFESFSFTPPMVTPALSIDQLSRDFSATNIAASTAAAATWRRLSAAVSGIAAGLNGVAANLGGQNAGEVITAAVDKISEVAAAGETFVRNSDIMATSVEQLAAIKSQGAVQVNLARAALTAIPNPVERRAAEQAFLATFPASFSPSVITGVPPIRNLMSMTGSGHGGGQIALGMDDVAGQGPARVDGLRAAGMAAHALGQSGVPGGTGQFGGVAEGVSQLAGIGGTPGAVTPVPVPAGAADAESLETVTAGLNTIGAGPSPATSPSGAAGGLPPGPAGFNNSTFGAPMGPLGQAGAASATNVGNTGASRGNAVLPGMPVIAATGAPGAAGAGGNRGTAGMPVGTGTGTGAARPMIGSGLGGGNGSGAGNGAGPAAPRGLGAPGGQPGGAPAGAGTAGAAAGQGRGMMPMMGAPMAGAGNQSAKTAKVRTVTSAVEEDGNLTALLGERHPVVPGVIGAWVRD